MFSTRRGPLCAETNPCHRTTPGSWGVSDASDLTSPVAIGYSATAGLGVTALFASPNANIWQSLRPIAVLTLLKADLDKVGVSLEGAVLLDLAAHAQRAKLATFAAWTQSAAKVYVNVDGLPALADSLKSNFPSVTDPAREAQLVYSMVAIRHEIFHVVQFKQTGRPTTYADMCAYEIHAYSATAAWMESKRQALVNLGMSSAVIDFYRDDQLEYMKKVSTALSEIVHHHASEAAQRDVMVKADLLPPHDSLTQLYSE